MKNTMKKIEIDGSMGEGGGQVLRSSLTLSMITGKPFCIQNIRAKRNKPGLLRQHLAAVRAAAELCGARVEGATGGSLELQFRPGKIQAGEYHVAIGTAGSTSLVLQTVLPAMLSAPGPCSIVVEGGTHNPMSPPVEFLQAAFLPLLKRMGANVEVTLERAGFFPAGGGRVRMTVEPCTEWKHLKLMSRDGIRQRQAVATLSDVKEDVGVRELKAVQRAMEFRDQDLVIRHFDDCISPGNVLQLIFESDTVTEVFTAFGRFGVPAKTVANEVCREARKYLEVDVPVGRHLADQLLIPLALAGGGQFRTLRPTGHTKTNITVIETFLPVRFRLDKKADGIVDIHAGPIEEGEET